MSGHSIFIRIDRDCMHRKLVGRAEDTDGNFLEKDGMGCYMGGLRHRVHELSYRTPRFATRIFVRGPPWPAALRRMVWMECTGVPGALGVAAKMGASLGG